MGLWYPKGSGFELTTFSDADHVGYIDTRKRTSGGIQFLEAEYVALSASCAQVMWHGATQLKDLALTITIYHCMNSESAIAFSCYPLLHQVITTIADRIREVFSSSIKVSESAQDRDVGLGEADSETSL
ncbi:hypothetical protein Tco_0865781 [Tanacetum coccineum]